MNKEIIDKLDEITYIIENDKDLIELKKIKKEILNDKEFVKKIEELKKISDYDNDYLSKKKEILSNEKYKRYIELENKLFFDIKDINKKLNTLVEKSGCN